MSGYLRLDGLTKRWTDAVAVGPVTLEIEQGEFLALLGPSGSGKTTILRLLAGFEDPDAGHVVVGGEEVTTVPPARRRFGMVFQHYALFPHLDVGANVAFGLRSATSDIAARVATALELVDLAGFERRSVQELSGGQQQRVALARALAPEPRVLLLDEPLSNLDPGLRERTRRELRAAIRRVGITTVFVTHEQEEAFALADRIALLDAGRLIQLGAADELYGRPVNLFAATFVGRANVLRGPVARAVGAAENQVAVVRPEAFRFASDGLHGTVRARRYTGPTAFYLVELHLGGTVEVLADPEAVRPGDNVTLEPGQVMTFPEAG